MPEKPTIYFISRNLTDYQELKGLIGSEIIESKGNQVLDEPYFNDIKQNDKIVVYVPSEGLIVDIFTVKSKVLRDYFVSFSRHAHLKVHDVESTMQLGAWKQFNFKRFINDNKNNPFENLKDVQALDEAFFIRSKGSITISEEEYNRIIDALENPVYVTHWNINPEIHSVKDSEHLSALLDFYNTRTTSFANLLVASIFGIATISAIIQTDTIQLNSLLTYVSMVPFLTICLAIGYTLNSYSYYADIAERIKSAALVNQYYKELNAPRITICEKKGIFRKTQYSYRNLLDYIQTKKRRNYSMKVSLLLCVSTLIALFIIGYWDFLSNQAWIQSVIGWFSTVIG